MFSALLLEKQNNETAVSLQELDESQLPAGGVEVAVEYTSLNYKDCLAIKGKGRIVSQWPMIPGTDLAGTVTHSSDPRFSVGDAVLVTGHGLGEQQWGGMAQKARVKSDWLIPMPFGLDTRKAMMLGSAGLAAILAVCYLQASGITPDRGEVLVTGASGGVGSIAVSLLSRLGYSVVALTGRSENDSLLQHLGTMRVLQRGALILTSKRLGEPCWSGVVDTVGGNVLSGLLSQIQYGGTLTTCGLVGGVKVNTTVLPFVQRGIRLLGVETKHCSMVKRQQVWDMLSALVPLEYYQHACRSISLGRVPEHVEKMLQGQITGRIVVKT